MPRELSVYASAGVPFPILIASFNEARRYGRALIDVLADKGAVSEPILIEALSLDLGLPISRAEVLPVDDEFQIALIRSQASAPRHLVVGRTPVGLKIAVSPTLDSITSFVEFIGRAPELRHHIVLTDHATIERSVRHACAQFRSSLIDQPHRLLEVAGLEKSHAIAIANDAGLAAVDPFDLAVRRGLIDEEVIARALAKIIERPFVSEFEAVGTPPPADAINGLEVARIRDKTGQAVTIVTSAASVRRVIKYVGDGQVGSGRIAVTTATRLRDALRAWTSERNCREAMLRLAGDHPLFSAMCPIVRRQIAIGVALLALVAAMIGLSPASVLVSMQAISIATIVAVTWPRGLAAISRRKTGSATAPLSESELPAYSVLVPLYKERRTVPGLIDALNRIDYPPEKLDIKLIVETDDIATRTQLANAGLAPTMDVIVVPCLGPRTKPKALSYAMTFASGAVVTIYDAEDRPDADQLRKVAARFASAPDGLGCIQAELAIDHPEDTWFTRLFALEYAALFTGLLPWMSDRNLAFPLGGTSNHIKRQALDQAGGWDPFNVTEDADLGVRLARYGWRLETIESTTWEEAPLGFHAWFSQRVRWYKGWLQTWLVHMRQPLRLYRDLGFLNFAMFQILIGGGLIVLLLHLAFTALLGCYVAGIVDLPDLVDVEAGAAVPVALHVFVGIAGFAAPALLIRKTAATRGLHAPLRRLLTLPAYWLLMAAALVTAIVDLAVRPAHWAKTEHGLAARPRPASGVRRPASDSAPGKSPVAERRARY